MAGSFASLFGECQRTIATHKKCIAAAVQLLEEEPNSIKEFIACVDKILVVDKRHPSVERCVTFISHFISSYITKDDSLWYVLLIISWITINQYTQG